MDVLIVSNSVGGGGDDAGRASLAHAAPETPLMGAHRPLNGDLARVFRVIQRRQSVLVTTRRIALVCRGRKGRKDENWIG